LRRGNRRKEPMMDVLLIVLTVVAFAALWALVAGMERV
jgi:hypothetical protein